MINCFWKRLLLANIFANKGLIPIVYVLSALISLQNSPTRLIFPQLKNARVCILPSVVNNE